MSNSKVDSEAIERVDSIVPSIGAIEKGDYQGKRVDDALQFALERGQATWTIEEEAKVLRKIDMTLLPLVRHYLFSSCYYLATNLQKTGELMIRQMFVGMCIAYADTQAYGFAALFGLVEDLRLFTVSVVKGQPVIDTTRYQFSAGIAALGSIAVRNNSFYLSIPLVFADLRRGNIQSLP
jgi:MFS transporter, ACS family, allantoate permease